MEAHGGTHMILSPFELLALDLDTATYRRADKSFLTPAPISSRAAGAATNGPGEECEMEMIRRLAGVR